MSNTTFRRTIHPTVKVIDAKNGLVEYVASDAAHADAQAHPYEVALP